ncbi:hemolysin [Candidatus Scalindua japonica]|uniref:Hemolysin n=1 Tax=Candidatus Scalindua japonica TaxID=1284222 RepID=A0A286TZF7_9BACT|nr:GNAT family N-acyltransferase [Candidatus Scalindua japonica]GAX61289.1 hemolysin [Candidatus Scalindua japonica]
MNLEVKIARTKKDLIGAFKLRYSVFGEELSYIDKTKYPDGREKDDFDDLPLTTNFVAKKNGETVGTVRLITNISQKYNIEDYVNIDDLKRDKNINLAEASRFCVRKDERFNVKHSHGLCKLVINFALSRDITDIIVLSNSTNSKEGNTIKYFKNIGFYQFADEIYYEKFNEYAIPLRLNLRNISEIMMYFLKKRTSYIEKPYEVLKPQLSLC